MAALPQNRRVLTPTPRRVAVVVNPATRGSAASRIAALRAALPPGVELDVYPTRSPGEGITLARAASDHADVVVAVGGDGTVADVATGVLGRGVPIAIVPAGSTNITAQELGIPSEPRKAAALIFGPHRLAALDVGRCGDRCFLHIAGAGLDSRFFQRTNRALKRHLGWLAYLPAAALTLRLPPARFTIMTDGRVTTVTSPLVLVANGGSIISPTIRLHPDIRADDGWLDVLIFTATEPLPVALTFGRLVTLSLADSPFLVQLRARQVELAAEPPLPVQLDGDVVGQTPASFDILPKAIEIIAPMR